LIHKKNCYSSLSTRS